MFTTATPTAISLTNLELVYDIVDFSGEVKNFVRSMADNNGDITIKSQSFGSFGSNQIPSGTTGSLELVYNLRYSSIKSLVANFSRATVNTFLDSVDITSNNGDYQFIIGGVMYPPRPLSTTLNKAGILSELAGFWGVQQNIDTLNMSINPIEFSYISNGGTTALIPGKFWVGCNTEALSTNNVLMSGISSQNSPVSLKINIGTATAENHQVTLIVLYDAILKINTLTNQVIVKQ
jgi:hypothetical protein